MEAARTQIFNIDIQLINAAEKGDLHHLADFPYGMALITTYLRQQGVKTLLLQYPIWEGLDSKRFLDQILDNPAHVYGFQVNFSNYEQIRDLMNIIREQNPGAVFVFGGPFVVCFYEQLLLNDPNLDAVVLGEGEFTLAELVARVKAGDPHWKEVHGIAYLAEDGRVVRNSHRPAIQNMDDMPFAARDGMEMGSYDKNGIYMHDVRITTSRGCTSNCSFCAVNLNSTWQHAKRWRGRSAKNVVDEMEEIIDRYNVRLFNLQDSSFDDPGTKRGLQRTRTICEEILERGLEVSMKCYFRAQSVKTEPENIELFKLYKQAGVDVIHVGAEAGSDFELEIYMKTATLEDNYRAFKVLQGLDLFWVDNGFIMFGPYSNLDSLRSNIKFLYENNIAYSYQNLGNSLIAYAGCSLYDQLEKEGRLLPVNTFWECPSYVFEEPRVLKLAQHMQKIREWYPHLDEGYGVFITAANLISRLKNKMNREIAEACREDTAGFTAINKEGTGILNELGYRGFSDNLERVAQDGLSANLETNQDQYFGAKWFEQVEKVKNAYNRMLRIIIDKGFGLGGLVWQLEMTTLERKTDTLSNMTAAPHEETLAHD